MGNAWVETISICKLSADAKKHLLKVLIECHCFITFSQTQNPFVRSARNLVTFESHFAPDHCVNVC